MNKPSVLTLRMPVELKEEVKRLAGEQGVSLNQYMLYVLTDRVARERTRQFFREVVGDRTPEQIRTDFESVLEKIGDRPPLSDDELPGMVMPIEREVAISAD